jgi:hypothetical protein
LKTFEKYDTQYQTFEALQSPVSTALGVYEELETIPQDGDKLQFLYEMLPHLNSQLLEKAKQHTSIARWENMLHIPSNLLKAYPMRIPEGDPKIISYKEEGIQREHDGYRVTNPFNDNKSDSQSSSSENVMSCREEESPAMNFGAGTLFKDKDDIFPTPFEWPILSFHIPGEPNILQGLATLHAWGAKPKAKEDSGQDYLHKGNTKHKEESQKKLQYMFTSVGSTSWRAFGKKKATLAGPSKPTGPAESPDDYGKTTNQILDLDPPKNQGSRNSPNPNPGGGGSGNNYPPPPSNAPDPPSGGGSGRGPPTSTK